MASMIQDIGRRSWWLKIHVLRFIVAFCGLSLTLMIFTQVIARYVLNLSIFGLEELAIYVAVWFYFLGGAIGAEQRGHISASLVDLMIQGKKGKALLRVITGSLSVVICAWMTWWSYSLVIWTQQMNMMSVELKVPMWLVQAAAPVGLALMTVYLLVEVVEDISYLLGRAPQ